MSMRQLKITKSITNRESQSLEKYLQEISRLELLTPQDEVKLAEKNKTRRYLRLAQPGKSQPAVCSVGCKAISKPGNVFARPY